MLKDITLGQYFPGNSPLHRLDPRMKIILAIYYIVIIFLAGDIITVGTITLLGFILAPIGRIPIKTLLKSLKPLRFILIFTAILNIFLHKGETAIFEFGIIHIYAEGIVYALLIALRLVALLIGTSMILTYTTSPSALTDAIDQLLSPLKLFHIPVHDFAMMMTIALRFIPTLVDETDQIMTAQKARGADFETGSLISRAKALLPIFIPLFVSSVRHAGELATAMECRCYIGGEGRTRMNKLHFHASDFVALILMSLLCVGVVFMRYLPMPEIICF